jgi:hypothetical protein
MLDFKHKSCNLDISNFCTLKCPKCMRVRWNDPKDIPGGHMTVDQFKKIVSYFRYIHFCGQVSDPIFNPHFIEFLTICKEMNKRGTIHTAASQRPYSWYERAFDANSHMKWRFSVDGLPNESNQYRINQDGEYLFEVMKMGASKGLHVDWQYIVFRYNEDHIQEAHMISKEHGINFIVNYSGRWKNEEDPYKPRNPEFSA